MQHNVSPCKKKMCLNNNYHLLSLTDSVAQTVKCQPAVWETWVRSLGQEDPLEKENGNPLQYSCLEHPMNRGAWQATAHGVSKESDTTEQLHLWILWARN